MSRFLFVVPPLAGHAYPAAAVTMTLRERGHEVSWVGSEAGLRPFVGPDVTVHPTGMRPYRSQLDMGVAAVKSLWESFAIPFARHMLPAVDKVVQHYRPDVVVTDGLALAGAIVAQRHSLPWATVTATLELSQSLRPLPKLDAWVMRQRAAVWAAAGLPGQEVRFSPYLVIDFSGRPLMTGVRLPGQAELVGAALADRPGAPDFPWDWLDPARRHVLVTAGTLAGDLAAGPGSFYSRAVQALHPLGSRLQAILVTAPGVVDDPPAHVLVAERVPMLALMPRLDAVVCHGGLNTVYEALAHGVPLVVAPIRWDQPFNARRVAELGAGIRVNFGRASPDQLRTAVTAVLDDPGYRGVAARIRDSLAEAGGRHRAADLLERLAPG
ncbi:MAG TPA: nucleotide disphospho-sugar-binding domain-containing protein [Streptosporangiaceae bacterium]|nr:nucleotide disphospho-sugar-binding domain-containing protein [Streptosporangiaceae bacterium]